MDTRKSHATDSSAAAADAANAAAESTVHPADAEWRIDTLVEKVADSARALGEQCEALRQEFVEAGAPLRGRAKNLADTVAAQARAHPLATFGAAFAAGAILARLLRR